MAVLNSLKRDFGLSLSWPSEGCDSYYEYCPQTILTKRLKTQLLAKHMVRSSGISPRTAAQLRKQTARMRNPAYFSETTPARSFLAAFFPPRSDFFSENEFSRAVLHAKLPALRGPEYPRLRRGDGPHRVRTAFCTVGKKTALLSLLLVKQSATDLSDHTSSGAGLRCGSAPLLQRAGRLPRRGW